MVRYQVSAVILGTALALVGYNGFNQTQAGEVKLAYINSNAIVAEAPGAEEAQATFEREMARWQSEVESLADSLQEMITAYEQQQVMLSPEAREQRQEQIQQKRLEFQQRTADLEQVAQRRRQELIQPIYDRITAVLMDVREEHSYTMIFDSAAGALIAADTALDITDIVIERLRAAPDESEGQGE